MCLFQGSILVLVILLSATLSSSELCVSLSGDDHGEASCRNIDLLFNESIDIDSKSQEYEDQSMTDIQVSNESTEELDERLSETQEFYFKEDFDDIKKCFLENSIGEFPSQLPYDPLEIEYRERDPVIKIDSVILDDIDIQNIVLLTQCVRDLRYNRVEDRKFDNLVTGYGGGNNVTYMTGIMQEVAPDFVNRVLEVVSIATEQAGWRPHPYHLGIRCVETLQYPAGGELLMHVDGDSIYTVMLMLSDPASFTGGEFVITKELFDETTSEREEIELVVMPEKGGGVVFDSEALHGVYPIESGERTVLIFELWPYEDSDSGHVRPSATTYASRRKNTPLLMVEKPHNDCD
mmetsp:Transcript_28896/g.29230  ORF Transcript_28896/g.29230 Transcript_28896/m.29230 type:complete len:349 (-) Transcript_28896:103-1149(-)